MDLWRPRLSVVVSLALMLALLLLAGCDNFLGSDDDETADSPVGQWITVLPESQPGPLGEDFRAAILEIDASQVTCIFYDETLSGVVQVSGFIAPYSLSGNQFSFAMTHAWLGEDPGVPQVTWVGKDWYEIPEGVPDPPDPDAFTVSGNTLTVLGPGLEFGRITSGLPAGLVGDWELDADNTLDLVGTSDRENFGELLFSWTDVETMTGSGYWQATGQTTGVLRQIYTEISTEPSLEYWEHLNPYVLDDDTLYIYMDLDSTVGDRLEYTPR